MKQRKIDRDDSDAILAALNTRQASLERQFQKALAECNASDRDPDIDSEFLKLGGAIEAICGALVALPAKSKGGLKAKVAIIRRRYGNISGAHRLGILEESHEGIAASLLDDILALV